MTSTRCQRARRILFWPLLGYALLCITCVPGNLRDFGDRVLGPSEAQLVVIADTPIHANSLTFNGQPIEPWPVRLWGSRPGYVLFPRLRWRHFEPVLSLSWTTEHGAQSLTRIMTQFDGIPTCLYVLRLGPGGTPVNIGINETLDPFWADCSIR